jgi:protein-S-isoprenylcysteine O-methyltransferase Ste14
MPPDPLKSPLCFEPFNSDMVRLSNALPNPIQAALFINIKTEGHNVAVFIFTTVTVIFLPLSFVTSYMGMNTKDIRDLDQGQWLFWAVAGPLSVAVLLLLWLIVGWGQRWRMSHQARRVHEAEDWKWGHQD